MLTRSKLIIFGIIGVGAFLLALGIAYLILFGGGGDGGFTPIASMPQNISLEIWGAFDDSDLFDPAIQAYQKVHPNVTLRYRKFIWDDYEPWLINALAASRGPDIFMIHNTWLGKHKDKLVAAPRGTGYPFVETTFKTREGILAYPLFIDNLALFYNKDLFAQAGFFDPPTTWEQFTAYVKALTKFSPTGSLLRSGVALGTNSKNINRATDILLLLMMQNGIELFDERGKVSWKDDLTKLEAAKDALRFYTDFANPSKTIYSWNEDESYSIDAFWEGSLVMMFNYAYNIETIKRKAPYLNFATASLPRKGMRVTMGNYWGLAVAKQSPHADIAWDFLKFFAQDEYYLPYIKQTGRLAAKAHILDTQKEDPLLKPFIDQASSMRTPYQPDEKRVEDILNEMIRNVNKGTHTYEQALRLAADRLQLLIK